MHNNHRFSVIACGIMSVATLSVIVIFYWLYDTSRENILAGWRSETQQAGQKISQYLKMPIDAVSFSAVTVDAMLREGRPHEDVLDYLVRETSIYSSIIDENSTGVYAYYKGRYLDGSGWTPPADYKPKKRPWYVDAVKNHGQITVVKPYLNLQTDTMMMSVSKLLSDNDSVVSMDIFLNGVQNLVEARNAMPEIRAALVVDGDGYVLAHSDKTRIGTRLDEGNETDREIMLSVAMKNGRFELNSDSSRVVFGEPVYGGWYAILVLDSNKLYQSLHTVYLASGAFLLFIMGTSLVAFLYMNRKNEQARKLEDEIRAAASIYISMFRIDFDKNSVLCIRDSPESPLSDTTRSFSDMMQNLADRIAIEPSRGVLESFLDPSTLEARLSGLNSITQEFMDLRERWVRLRFIVISRHPDDSLQRVLMAFESIDEDKRRQENLRRLSETDSMTGIRNRGSGERLVRRAMAEGRKGMFCLMDADKFKFINDSFGHGIGDKVIIAIADCLKRIFRDTDVVFRLGGDEFSAYADGVDSQEIGEQILHRFFNAINAVHIPELGEHRISLSVGATFYSAVRRDSFEEMYKRADEATYESKKHPGNCMSFKLQRQAQ